MADRFDHLEGPHKLPDNVEKALNKLNRFEHLEIGAKPATAAPKPAPRSQRLCPRCAQANEPERTTCWACYKPLTADAAPTSRKGPDDVTIVLDGKTYKSSDKDLPDDVAALIKRIQEEGYSETLLAEWRSWRATRRSPKPSERPFDVETRGEDAERDIKVFKGQRVSVIRLDGKVYTSDDKNLTPEMQALFAYIDREGVTPELMESLRRHGPDVKLRPASTAMPSDGDVAFWKDVAAKSPPAVEGPIREQRDDNATLLFLAVAAGLYLAIRLLSCA